MSEKLERETGSTTEENEGNFLSRFSFDHPISKGCGFLFGDIVSLIFLLNSGGWWATFAFGAVVAFTLAFFYSVVLAYTEHHRQQNLIPISILPRITKKEQTAQDISQNQPLLRDKQEVTQPIANKATERKSEERPNILTKLVIDTANAHKVDFHIEIENIGKVNVKNIRASFYTDEFSDIEIASYIPRMLPHGGKLSITTAQGVLEPKKNTSLIVKIFFNSCFDGFQRNFSQKVRFFIRPSDLKIQTINPEAREEIEVDNDLNGQDITLVLTQFNRTLGTIALVLKEIGKSGNPNVIYFGNEYRIFSFDSLARIVSFRTKTSSGRLISLDLPILESKNGIHIVMIMWDYAKGGFLRLDNNEKDEMGENKNNI